MHLPNLHTTPKEHLITIGTFSTKTILIQKSYIILYISYRPFQNQVIFRFARYVRNIRS